MLFEVENGGPVDVLDETAGPYSVDEAKIIGQIPSGTKALMPIGETFQLEDGRVFMAVRFEGRNGWVDAARLTRRWSEDWEVERLYCGGTEPFWGMSIEGETAELQINEETFKLRRQLVLKGANRRDVRELRWDTGPDTWVSFISDRPTCSDGSSDFFYPLEILISTGQSQVATGALVGCCSFVPE
jgi:uncharacterized membrane protein